MLLRLILWHGLSSEEEERHEVFQLANECSELTSELSRKKHG